MPTPTAVGLVAESGPVIRSTKWTRLLEAARDGDDDALGQMCQHYREVLWLAVDKRLGDDLRAKFGASDVVQQSMLEAHGDFRHFAGSSETQIFGKKEHPNFI